ncbi:hypothetical protein [Pectobacterium sp. CFBP8739]|uniref:hypothetical protein n=1 Tax=unclassified Pectobacterium TaxID=2627739 RepID=UPI0015DF1AE5|nr:hypothetical protein [Pectobacterium sp. CFBP8739]MBA0168529.1 hypothetical protein [Pectobacterium sp. CFBP8739]
MSNSGNDTGYIVVIEEKQYDLAKVPPFNDPLVQREKKSVLGQLSLNDITQNLDLSVELFYVAYHGVAGAKGGSLQAEIARLQSRLAMLCNECITTMTTFQSETQNIIELLQQCYRWLTKGQEKLAFKKLAHCKESSSAMSVKAILLAEQFKALQVDSTKAKSNTILEEASENDRLLAAQKAERETIAKQKAQEANQQALLEDIATTQALYEDAKNREAEESTKALVLGIVSAVTNAIGAGLGAYSAAKNPVAAIMSKAGSSIDDNAQIKAAQSSMDSAKQEFDKAQKKYTEAADQLSAQQSIVNSLKDELDVLNTALTNLEKDSAAKPEDIAALRVKRSDKETEHSVAAAKLPELTKTAKSLEKEAKDSSKAYAAAGTALTNLATSTSKMAETAASTENSVREERINLLNKQLELQKEKRASLVALAEYAESLKNLKVEQGNSTLSVNSLHSAIDALGKVIGTLTNASLFWDQMSQYCDRMTSSGFQRDLEDLKEMDLETRLEEYQDPHFMRSFFLYLCQWVAVNGLSGDYLLAAADAQKKAVQYLSESPTIQEAIRKAPELAKNLALIVQNNLLASRNQSIELEQQRAILIAQ